MINKQYTEQRLIEDFMNYHNERRLQPYHSSLDLLQPVLLRITTTTKFEEYDFWKQHYKYGALKLDINELYKFTIKFLKST